MKNRVSWKDVVLALILATVFFLRFDVVTATLVFIATAFGVFAVRRHMTKKDRP